MSLGGRVLDSRGTSPRTRSPETVGSPFERLNRRIYSPFCLALASLTWAAAR